MVYPTGRRSARPCGFVRFWAVHFCPVGTVDSSPAVHCWEGEWPPSCRGKSRRDGRNGAPPTVQPSLRDGGGTVAGPRYPAMNRWAIVIRPSRVERPSLCDVSASGVAGPHGTVYDVHHRSRDGELRGWEDTIMGSYQRNISRIWVVAMYLCAITSGLFNVLRRAFCTVLPSGNCAVYDNDVLVHSRLANEEFPYPPFVVLDHLLSLADRCPGISCLVAKASRIGFGRVACDRTCRHVLSNVSPSPRAAGRSASVPSRRSMGTGRGAQVGSIGIALGPVAPTGLQHFGVDDARIQRHGGHTGGQFLGHGTGKPFDGPLGGALRGDLRRHGAAPAGTDVDDHPWPPSIIAGTK